MDLCYLLINVVEFISADPIKHVVVSLIAVRSLSGLSRSSGPVLVHIKGQFCKISLLFHHG
jgi:hypothetical protein